MKTLKFKVFSFAAIALILAATVVSCSKNESNPSTEYKTTYIGGEYGNARYFKKYLPTAGVEVIIVTKDGKSSLTHSSPVWGLFTFDEISVTDNGNGTSTIYGEGKAEMKSDHSDNINNYDEVYVSGTITGNHLVATFSIPELMGGFELLFNPDDFLDVFNKENPSISDTTDVDTLLEEVVGDVVVDSVVADTIAGE